MSLPLTLALAALFAALTAVCAWAGARAARPMRPPRLIPWRLIMLFTFAACLAMLVHIVSLVRAR